jgi:ParB-like nuclease domain
MKVRVSDLKPNPFRHLDRLPLREDKIAALMRSIKDTSFWDNLLGRKNKDGDIEIAYGHHRIEALRRLKIDEIDMNVRKLSNEDMAKIMAHENMDEWGHSSDFEVEVVRSIIDGFAAGLIELPKVRNGHAEGRARVLISPRGEIKYTAATISDFLGWTTVHSGRREHYRADAALAIIDAQTDDVIDSADIDGTSTRQAREIVSQARRVMKQTGDKTLAKKVAKKIASGMRKGSGGRYQKKEDATAKSVTIHNAKEVADEAIKLRSRPDIKPKSKKLPDFKAFVSEITVALEAVWKGKGTQRMNAIIEHAESMPESYRTRLVAALRREAAIATGFADKLESVDDVIHVDNGSPRRLTHHRGVAQ